MEEEQVIQQPYVGQSASVGDDNDPPIVDAAAAASAPLEKWTKTIHPRGRQARDPLAQVVQHQVINMEAMKQHLGDYLADPTYPAEHTTIEFTFPTSAAFMVYTADYLGSKDSHRARASILSKVNRTAISVIDALNQPDPKEQLRKQKSIAKSIVEAMADLDGFRYSFHNNWLSKEDEACRFSYYCNDSTLNKGRAANEGAGMEGKKKVKPVYDCKGAIWIKFSITKNNLEVQYRHIPVHKTYEERAPPPRRDSKRRKLMELFNPDKLPKIGRKRRPEDQVEKPKKRRATEPPQLEADSGTEEARQEGLAPLMDFLGAANEEARMAPGAAGETAEMLQESNSGTPVFPTEKLQALKDNPNRRGGTGKELRVTRPIKRTPGLPGMMSGYMAGDLITWGERGSHKSAAASPTVGAEPLAVIVDAAAEAGPSTTSQAPGQMSELDLLKAKLAEAEARIHNLEAEKTRPQSLGPPGWPPPPGPPPPPQQQQYSYPPPPPYAHYHTPQYQQPVTQGQHQPPDRQQTQSPAYHVFHGPTPPGVVQDATASSFRDASKDTRAAAKKGRSSGAGVNGQMA
jgi:hypothetical protein